jgi:hypothetical protein
MSGWRQPEAVAAGFKSDSDAIDVPPGFHRFIPPAMQQPQQRLLVRFEFLQRVALDPRNDPGNEPTRETQFNHRDDRAILFEGDEGPAEIIRLWHGALHWLIFYSADGATPSPPAP